MIFYYTDLVIKILARRQIKIIRRRTNSTLRTNFDLGTQPKIFMTKSVAENFPDYVTLRTNFDLGTQPKIFMTKSVAENFPDYVIRINPKQYVED